MSVDEILRQATQRVHHTAEAIFLGRESMAELHDHVRSYAAYYQAELGNDGVRTYAGLPVVPCQGPAVSPWRVELHCRDYSGQPIIDVLRL